MTTKALLKKLMAFRPVTADVKAVNRLVDFLRGYLRAQGVRTKVEGLGGRKILYASTVRGKHTPLLFNAHLDVVPADEAVFGAREKRGWIHGRGAGDCLGNAAMTANLLVRCRRRARIGAIFTTDEEVGGHTTQHMVSQGYTGDFVFVVDGGGYRVAVAQKGILVLRLTARGKGCHGSTPWRGENALDKLIDGYRKVRKLFPPVREGDDWHDTMSANMLRAGTVFNRVPDRAELYLDVRTTGRRPRREVLRRVRAASGLKVEVVIESPQVFCDVKDPRMQDLIKFMTKKLRHKIGIVRMNGATDARHFVGLRAPIAMIGAPSRGVHSSKEAVSLKGLALYEEMLYSYCQAHAVTPTT
jgi:succinyl-diaminopimelate desuccinylase